MHARSWLACLALTCGGCAGEANPSRDHSASTSQRVAGMLDEEQRYSGVVGFLARKGDLVARCSGALVAPNLMLTARHCVAFDDGNLVSCGASPLGDSVDPAGVLVTARPVMSDVRGDYVAATEILPAPGGDDTCGFDFAAVRLEDTPPGVTTFYTPRLDEPVVAGEVFTAVGYGSDEQDQVGQRHYLGAKVACAGEACELPEVQSDEWLAEDGAFCRADSGAPALDFSGMLIGTVSRGQNPCATPILTAMAPWSEWLVELGRSSAQAGGYATPEWAGGESTSPEPDPEPAAMPDSSDAKQKPTLKNSCAFAAPTSAAPWWLLLPLLGARRSRARRGRRGTAAA